MATNWALASNGSTIFTTNDYPAYPNSRLIDGADSPEWYSLVAPSVGSPHIQEITFPSAKVINQFEAVGHPSYKNKDWTLEYWTGSIWNVLDTVTNNSVTNYSKSFSPVSTTKIRLVVTAVHNGYVCWQELKAWGEDMPQISTNSALPDGAVGVAVSGSFAATGGSGSGTFAVQSGSPPTGVSIASNGSRSGTPSVTGNFNFTIRYTDANSVYGYVDKVFDWTINAAPPLNYGFKPTDLELFCEASNLALADNANVTSFTDQSVHSRHLTASSAYPTNQTNEINGKPVVRFSGSNPLKNTSQFTIRCGWILAKYDAAAFPDTADGYKGLLSDLVDKVILSGKRNTAEFYDNNFEFFEFRSNDRITSENDLGELHAPAPMNAFKLIFFKFWTNLDVNGIQLGQELNNANRKWSGDVALLILTSRDFCESEIRAKSEAIATAYNLTLANVFPYQADKASTFSDSRLVNFYDPPEGDRILEAIDDTKQVLSLKFTVRQQSEFKKARIVHRNNYPDIPIIYRNYNIIPPEDVEGYISSELEWSGAVNNMNYGFELQEK